MLPRDSGGLEIQDRVFVTLFSTNRAEPQAPAKVKSVRRASKLELTASKMPSISERRGL